MKLPFPCCVIAGLSLLLSCHQPNNEVNIPRVDTFPREVVKQFEVMYTEYGLPKIKLSAPLVKRYVLQQEEKVVMPKGIFLIFYDSAGNEQATLRAKYAERLVKEKKTILRYEVVAETSDGKKLTSEELIWDEQQHKVFSNSFVRITTPDKVIWGDGFESDEQFERYQILRPKGEIAISEKFEP